MNPQRRYILDGKEVKASPGLFEWARWLDKHDRHVARTVKGDVEVSTVFLGLDHRFGGDGPPLVFETMVFGGDNDGELHRYSTWEQAETGHAKVCAVVLADAPAP